MTRKEFKMITAYIQAFVDETMAQGTIPHMGEQKILYSPEQMDKLVARIELLVEDE